MAKEVCKKTLAVAEAERAHQEALEEYLHHLRKGDVPKEIAARHKAAEQSLKSAHAQPERFDCDFCDRQDVFFSEGGYQILSVSAVAWHERAKDADTDEEHDVTRSHEYGRGHEQMLIRCSRCVARRCLRKQLD